MKKIMCPICGTEFETNKPNKKYCSLTCKEAGQKLRRMNWKDNNPHYIAEYMRNYRAEKKK